MLGRVAVRRRALRVVQPSAFPAETMGGPPVYGLLLLATAIVFEVIGTSALRASEGFSRLWPSVVVAVSYGVSFLCLSLALKTGLSMGPAYAIWSGVGTALITIVGLYAFSDKITPIAYAGIAVIILGVVLVNLGGGGAH